MTVLPGTDETVTPGAALCSARQAAGLSVGEIAAQMRISPRQVQALEADRYADLPGAVFVRGFIRNYARVLKLDPVPLLYALEPALDPEAPLRAHATAGTLPVSARRDHSRLLLVLFGVLFVAVIVAGGYELWSRQKEQGRATPAPEKSVKSISVPPAAPLAARPEPADSHALASPSALQDSVPVLPQAVESPVAPARAIAEPASSDSDSRVPGPRAARIGMHFTRTTWVEIRDREGRVVFSGTGQATSEQKLEATPPLSVIVGDAGGVRITYNGKPLDVASPAARNIARFTLE